MARPIDDDDTLHDESFGHLMKRLTADLLLLMRQELDLFRAEMSEKVREIGQGAVMLSAAAISGVLALGTLTAAVILLLSLMMPAWLGALIVSAIYGLACIIFAVSGKARIEDVTPIAPTQTIETVKEDIAWAKTRTTSGNR